LCETKNYYLFTQLHNLHFEPRNLLGKGFAISGQLRLHRLQQGTGLATRQQHVSNTQPAAPPPPAARQGFNNTIATR